MITLGIIGLGKWGRNYLSAINEIDSSIKVIVGNRLNWYELVKSKQCDGIIIATPPDSHIKIAMEVLQTNTPVMIEKPLAINHNEALQLQEFENNSIILVNHLQLFSPAFEFIKKTLHPTDILSIFSQGSNDGPIRTYSSLLDYGPHDLSMGLYLSQTQKFETNLLYKLTTETGYLYNLDLQYDKNINHKITVGNGDTVKHRIFKVTTKSNDIWTYDDTLTDKLWLNDTIVPISSDKPLTKALSCFIKSINGYTDDRFGIKLALDIADILGYCHRVLK